MGLSFEESSFQNMMKGNKFSPIVRISPLLNDVIFDDYIINSEYFLSKNSFFDDEKALISYKEVSTFDLENETNMSCTLNRNESICFCITNILKGKPLLKMKYNLDMLFFSVFMNEIKSSKIFRSNVLRKLLKFANRHFNSTPIPQHACECCYMKWLYIHVNVYLTKPKKDIIDYKWNKKLEVLINERCELDNAMAWLSTLGGAFSALGDYFVDCAEKAGLISVQQLKIALRLGDPITICQCKIYLAMSLLQRGHYSKSKTLLRELYSFAVSPEGSKYFRLRNMCIAVWNKLKYTLQLKRKIKIN